MTMWVFGYGSLIWNSGFPVAQSRVATLHGFSRSFCMWSVTFRGTPARPGLVLGLAARPEAHCRGVALQVTPGAEDDTLAYLRERELTASAYEERIVRLSPDDGAEVDAVTYVVNPGHDLSCANLDLEGQAQVIARATGNRGANSDYLFNTVAHLEGAGIADSDLCWLAGRVKDLIA